MYAKKTEEIDMNSKVVVGGRGILETKNTIQERETKIIMSQIFRDPFWVSKDLIQSPTTTFFWYSKNQISHTLLINSHLSLFLIFVFVQM